MGSDGKLSLDGPSSREGSELAEGERVSMCHYEGLTLGVEVATKGVTCPSPDAVRFQCPAPKVQTSL